MGESTVKRLREGKTLLSIIRYLMREHPKGMQRSQVQERLKGELGVGESTGGVNRHMKRLREAALIDWDQGSYTYTLPPDYDSKEYFIRIVETFNMSTDQAYFLSLEFKNNAAAETLREIEDYIGFRYDREMNDNINELQNEYKMNEVRVHDDITKILTHHNSYVRLRLFKTVNECFLRDLTELPPNPETKKLREAYTKNLKSIENEIKKETSNIFRRREELIKYLKEKRLSKRMKFLTRFALNHTRPSHVYDGLI
ncbi:MAG: hypothetical protein V1744_03485 [Candidatus Altiarchaeota archaeon]